MTPERVAKLKADIARAKESAKTERKNSKKDTKPTAKSEPKPKQKRQERVRVRNWRRIRWILKKRYLMTSHFLLSRQIGQMKSWKCLRRLGVVFFICLTDYPYENFLFKTWGIETVYCLVHLFWNLYWKPFFLRGEEICNWREEDDSGKGERQAWGGKADRQSFICIEDCGAACFDGTREGGTST